MTHYYKSENVKLLNLHITSLYKPVRAPSTDAIDVDACRNMLVKGCFMSVDDDAVALKGGKGPWADDPVKMPENGGNEGTASTGADLVAVLNDRTSDNTSLVGVTEHTKLGAPLEDHLISENAV